MLGQYPFLIAEKIFFLFVVKLLYQKYFGVHEWIHKWPKGTHEQKGLETLVYPKGA